MLRSRYNSTLTFCLIYINFNIGKIANCFFQFFNVRNWFFATNPDYLIPTTLQPKVVDPWYFQLWICGKDSIPCNLFNIRLDQIMIFLIELHSTICKTLVCIKLLIAVLVDIFSNKDLNVFAVCCVLNL